MFVTLVCLHMLSHLSVTTILQDIKECLVLISFPDLLKLWRHISEKKTQAQPSSVDFPRSEDF